MESSLQHCTKNGIPLIISDQPLRMMDDSIKELLEQGKITLEIARANAHNPKLFQ